MRSFPALRTLELQHGRSLCLPISPSLLKFMSTEQVMLSYHHIFWHFSFCLQSFPESGSFLMSWLFASCCQNTGDSGSATIPISFRIFQFVVIHTTNIQIWFPELEVWSPCIPSDFQESSPALQFENINSPALDLLYGPILTFEHEYCKSNSFDSINISLKSDASAY